MTFDVFISYSHQDKAVADAACAKLEFEGIRVLGLLRGESHRARNGRHRLWRPSTNASSWFSYFLHPQINRGKFTVRCNKHSTVKNRSFLDRARIAEGHLALRHGAQSLRMR